MVGSGIFASSGVVFQHTRSGGSALGVWIASGIVALAGALCFTELGTCMPSAGGEVEFLRRAYGEEVSFLFTWTNVFVTRPASFAIICLVFGEYACTVLYPALSKATSSIIIPTDHDTLTNHTHDVTNVTTNASIDSTDALLELPSTCSQEISSAPKTLAMCCCVIVIVLNCISVRMTTTLLGGLTVFKVGVLAAVALSGLFVLLSDNRSNPLHAVTFEGTSTDLSDYPVAFLAALFAYDGWNNCIYAAEEMIDVNHQLAAVRLGVPLVTVLYVVVNASYIIVLPPEVVSTSHTLGDDLMYRVAGDAARVAMPFCVASSALGAALGGVFSASRLIYASGRDTILPKAFGRLHPQLETPVNALLFQFALTSLLIALGDFEALLGLFGVAVWLFYFLTVAGMLRLRRLEPNLPRPYRAPTILALAFCLVTIVLLMTEFASAPLGSFGAISFVFLGYPYYRLWHWKFGVSPQTSSDSATTVVITQTPIVGGYENLTHDVESRENDETVEEDENARLTEDNGEKSPREKKTLQESPRHGLEMNLL